MKQELTDELRRRDLERFANLNRRVPDAEEVETTMRSGETTMQSITFEVAKKLVSYVRDNPGSTLEQVVQNVPELTDMDLRDFVIDGSPCNHDSLIIIDADGRVQLGDAGYLTEVGL